MASLTLRPMRFPFKLCQSFNINFLTIQLSTYKTHLYTSLRYKAATAAIEKSVWKCDKSFLSLDKNYILIISRLAVRLPLFTESQ